MTPSFVVCWWYMLLLVVRCRLYKVFYCEYLLEIGIFVDNAGRKSRDEELVWPSPPTSVGKNMFLIRCYCRFWVNTFFRPMKWKSFIPFQLSVINTSFRTASVASIFSRPTRENGFKRFPLKRFVVRKVLKQEWILQGCGGGGCMKCRFGYCSIL